MKEKDPIMQLRDAVEHHQAGRLAEAERGYRGVLSREPRQADAHHNLGVLLMQAARGAEGLAHLKAALEGSPEQGQYWVSYVGGLLTLGEAAEAKRVLTEGLQRGLQGPQVEALVKRLGQREGGGKKPAVEDTGPTAETIQTLMGWYEAGRHAEVERSARSLTQRYPGHGFGWQLLGVVLRELGRPAEALGPMEKAATLMPGDAMIQYNLGLILQSLNRLQDAETHYRHALSLNPTLPEALCNLGQTLYAQGRLTDAEIYLRQAIELQTSLFLAHGTLASVLHDRGCLQDAEAGYRRVLELKPNLPDAHINLGNVLKDQGRMDEAAASYLRATQISPEMDEPHLNLAFLLLGVGRFSEGWLEYCWRPSGVMAGGNGGPGGIVGPEASWGVNPGQAYDCQGKRLGVLKDQGLGDELFFLRFVEELRKRGAWVGYVADPRLKRMIERAGWVDRLVEREDQLGEVDLKVSVGDLPLLLGMSAEEEIPPPGSLAVLEGKAAEVEALLAMQGIGVERLIGVTWRGGVRQRRGGGTLYKEIAVEELAGALKDVDATYVVVQREPVPGEVERFRTVVGRRVIDCSELNGDLEGMLALMARLDEYVGVSNTNMHLRASVGKVGHVLVPDKRDYRWMLSGETSPWFPGFRVYRATAGERGWRSAFQQLKENFALDNPRAQ